MYFWAYCVVLVSDLYMITLVIGIVLTPRLNKNMNALIVVLVYMPLCYAKMKTAGTAWETAYVILNSATIVFLPSFIALMYKDKMINKLICMVIILASEIIAMSFMPATEIERNGSFYLNYNSIADFGRYILTLYFDVVLMTFFVTLYKLFMDKSLARKNGMLISLFIVNQIIIIHFFYSMKNTDNNIQFSLNVTYGIIAEYFADLFFLFAAERESEQEVLRRGIRNVQRELELERVRYEALCERRSELAKLRHDYNNQLTAAQLLLESGNGVEAGRIISGLRSRLRER